MILCLHFIVTLKLYQFHLQGGRALFTGRSKGEVNSLKDTISGLTPVKWEANSSLKEVTTPAQVFRSIHQVRKLTSS